MFIPIAFSFSRAISASISRGTGYTATSSFFSLWTRCSALSAWFAKLMSITLAG